MSKRDKNAFGQRRLWSNVAATIAVLLVSSAVPVEGAFPSMKLLSRTIGWGISDGHLYWTTDSGDHWTDITPQLIGVRKRVGIGPVFFRDTAEGWAVLFHLEAFPGDDSAPIYSFAHTTNGGSTWSITELNRPKLPADLEAWLVGPAHLFFVDSRHGWMDMAATGNSQPGKMLATVDGGQTWTWSCGPTSSGPLAFVSPQDGFHVGYFGTDALFATHDGCKTWQRIELAAPAQAAGIDDVRFHGAPIFQDSRHGYTEVYYVGDPDQRAWLVVYSTDDSGKTWHPAKVLSASRGLMPGLQFPIVDSSIVVPTGRGAEGSSIAAVRLDGGMSSVTVSGSAAPEMTFADTSNGWKRVGQRLGATRDGGSTWTDIGPDSAHGARGGETDCGERADRAIDHCERGTC